MAGKASYARADTCLPHALVPATVETKFFFGKFVDHLKKQDSKYIHCLYYYIKLTKKVMLKIVLYIYLKFNNYSYY